MIRPRGQGHKLVATPLENRESKEQHNVGTKNKHLDVR